MRMKCRVLLGEFTALQSAYYIRSARRSIYMYAPNTNEPLKEL
jgi:hypothetical protein